MIGRQVLEGSDMVQNDDTGAVDRPAGLRTLPLPAGDLRRRRHHYIAVNNKQGPFANVNLRKALWAALDRVAMNKARGGELVTNVMTHFLYPEIPGFEQAGGLTGPKVDYNELSRRQHGGRRKVHELAGYPSGKYTGAETLQIVGSTGSPMPQDAEIVNQTLQNLGFKTKLSLVDQSVMYAKYCGVPAEEIDVCPNVGWVADFGDPQAVLDVPFNGKNIESTNNNN